MHSSAFLALVLMELSEQVDALVALSQGIEHPVPIDLVAG